jgi:hypothetical protein
MSWSRVSGSGADFDLDGCTDAREAGPNQTLGGRRNPQHFWDVMDQWIGGSRNEAITAGDVAAVVSRFGSSGNPAGNPLTPPGGLTGYHAIADRNGAYPGQSAWNLRPPNGSITAGDVAAAVGQFGHTCA